MKNTQKKNNCRKFESKSTWRDAWRTFEEFYKNGKIRALGVSNFNLNELKEEIINLNKTIEEKNITLEKLEKEITEINKTNNTSEVDKKLLKLKEEEEALISELDKENQDDKDVNDGEKQITKLIEGKKS